MQICIFEKLHFSTFDALFRKLKLALERSYQFLHTSVVHSKVTQEQSEELSVSLWILWLECLPKVGGGGGGAIIVCT